MEDGGELLQVVDVAIRYRQSVTYDNVVQIDVTIAERKRAAITLAYEVRRELLWDSKEEQFIGDAEANSRLSREKRGDWKLG